MPYILEATITRTFLERVRLTPDAIGFQIREPGASGGWSPISFRRFYEECEQVALGLLASGATEGDRIAIASRSRYEWALADMAILAIRGITVPIYPSLPAADFARLVRHSEARFLFAEDAAQRSKALAERETCASLRSIFVFEGSGPDSFATLQKLGAAKKPEWSGRFEELLLSSKSDDVFTISYTSGTSGEPKGAMLTHSNLMSAIGDTLTVVRKFTAPESETLLTFLPFSHIIGRGESLATFTYGWRESYVLRLEDIPQALLEVKPTVLFAVPRIFEKSYARFQEVLAKSGAIRRAFEAAQALGSRIREDRAAGRRISLVRRFLNRLAALTLFRLVTSRFGGRLRFVACGGAPLSVEIARFFQALGIEICEGYGLTETCAPVTLNTPESWRQGSVGKPLPDVQVRIASDGEILIRSKKVFQGYYKMPEETAAALKDGWFHTGDLGRLDSDGFLYVTGRKKDLLITSGGKNVAPQKIENIAAASGFFSHLVVLGDRRPYLVALVTLNRAVAEAFAGERSIRFERHEDLIANPEVLAKAAEEIDKINSALASFETIKKFSILPVEFTVEGGHLTPTLKVRRSRIAAEFAHVVDRLYEADRKP